MPKSWVIERSRLEHCEQHREEAISKTAQGAPVTVPFLSQTVIMFPTARIILHADAGPVLERVAEPNVAPKAHQHGGSFSALSCNRRDAGVGSKGMIVSVCD